jgi:hypothetical protein
VILCKATISTRGTRTVRLIRVARRPLMQFCFGGLLGVNALCQIGKVQAIGAMLRWAARKGILSGVCVIRGILDAATVLAHANVLNLVGNTSFGRSAGGGALHATLSVAQPSQNGKSRPAGRLSLFKTVSSGAPIRS